MASSKENRQIHLVSSVAEVVISGDSVVNDSRKDLAKEVKMDIARFTWEPHGVLILNCLRQLCFKLMLSWIVERQKQLVVSKQCRFWLMLYHKIFLILALKWTLWTDHGFVLPMVTEQGYFKSLIADSLGMDQHLHFGCGKRARSCRYELSLRIVTFPSHEMSFWFMMLQDMCAVSHWDALRQVIEF